MDTSERKLSREEFDSFLGLLAKATGKELNHLIVEAYYERLGHNPASKLVTVFSSSIANLRFPTVDELETKLGSRVITSDQKKETKIRREGPDHEDWHFLKIANHEDGATVAVRVCKEYPYCTELEKSVDYWNHALAQIRAQGWLIDGWKEFSGEAEFQMSGSSGKKVLQKDTFYYAMAFLQKPKKYSHDFTPSKDTATKTNDFTSDQKCLASI